MASLLRGALLLLRVLHHRIFNQTHRPVMLRQGEKAPDIEAISTDGSTFRLADHRGRHNVLLYFYPMDDTAGCTRQACDLRDRRSEFDARDTLVVGVSTDDLESHRRFTDKYSLNFPLLVDADRTICRAFGVPCEGAAKRVSFLIDRDGTVARVWDPVDVRSHAGDVLESVTASNAGTLPEVDRQDR